MASLSASLSVLEPASTLWTVAPKRFMRYTLTAWRCTSSAPMYTSHCMPSRAATVAVATPCWPAPVSAMTRFLPMACASSAWPTVLLILCAPVWLRSSRLSTIFAPPTLRVRFSATYSGEGRPTKCARSESKRATKSPSDQCLRQACSSSSRAAMSVSATKRPPNTPKCPPASGSEVNSGCFLATSAMAHRLYVLGHQLITLYPRSDLHAAGHINSAGHRFGAGAGHILRRQSAGQNPRSRQGRHLVPVKAPAAAAGLPGRVRVKQQSVRLKVLVGAVGTAAAHGQCRDPRPRSEEHTSDSSHVASSYA